MARKTLDTNMVVPSYSHTACSPRPDVQKDKHVTRSSEPELTVVVPRTPEDHHTVDSVNCVATYCLKFSSHQELLKWSDELI